MPRLEIDFWCYFFWEEGEVEVRVWLDGRWQGALYPLDLDQLLRLGRAGYEQALAQRFIADRQSEAGRAAA